MTLVLSSSFQSYPGSRKAISDQKCGICLDFFGEKLKIVSHENSLYHVFHESCLKKWASIKPECPLCRKKIVLIGNQNFLLPKKWDETRIQWLVMAYLVWGSIFLMPTFAFSPVLFSEPEVGFMRVFVGVHVFFSTAIIADIIYQRYML